MPHVRSTMFFILIVQQMLNRMAQTTGTSESAGLGGSPRGGGFACTFACCVAQCLARNKVCSPQQPALKFAPKILVVPCRKEGKGSLITLPEICPHLLPLHEPSEHLGDTTLLPQKSTRYGEKEVWDSLFFWCAPLGKVALLQLPSLPFHSGLPVLFVASYFCLREEIFGLM